ncbi:uncharacterized protein K452DRAFT_13401 [Aplosporella prunicola CBS 121167]|uniref:Uncharacterized protein n=1 Tax=Aplosporella prunicola CBS 121167 TaxID=1176127 RepID=A0A6A6BHN5_9PEZI|nr:uncharacterized protein K452DRAFT_13401 [Aplosporella prunicola CBS 121167]KAF2142953.1 hypothetical protein K452DRAFT_13401 [Aplosporella prunicola CBS 121167]
MPTPARRRCPPDALVSRENLPRPSCLSRRARVRLLCTNVTTYACSRWSLRHPCLSPRPATPVNHHRRVRHGPARPSFSESRHARNVSKKLVRRDRRGPRAQITKACTYNDSALPLPIRRKKKKKKKYQSHLYNPRRCVLVNPHMNSFESLVH